MAINEFRIDVPQADLDDLAARLDRTRWPHEIPDQGWQRGVPVAYLRELAAYWRDGYDWRATERRLNTLPMYETEIDGQHVHFIHVRSPHADALPLVLTHGWPGSIVEFEQLIGPLTDPADPADPADAFHVVIPSLPGFGFSGATNEAGWDTGRIARAWDTLMRTLGYERYGAQGGDVGAGVSPEIGRLAPERVVGVHVNAATVGFMPFPPLPDDELAALTDAERAKVGLIETFLRDESGYSAIQSTRPQTLAYGLADSPIGQLAWIVEKFKQWTDVRSALPHDAVDRDRLLDNVMLYWLTNTGGSSAQLYYEDAQAWSDPPEPSGVPTGVAVFAQDPSVRRYAERQHTVVRWTDFAVGGHFAALETPELLLTDVRAFFRQVRS